MTIPLDSPSLATLAMMMVAHYTHCDAAIVFTDLAFVSGNAPVAQNGSPGAGVGVVEAFDEPLLADNTTAGSFAISTPNGISAIVREGNFVRADNTSPVTTDYSTAFSIIDDGSNIGFELSLASGGNGTGQNSGGSDAFGFDTGPGADGGDSNVLIFDFTGSATGVRYFEADVLDLEGGNLVYAIAAVFATDGSLIESTAYNWGPPPQGEGIAGAGGYGDDSEINFAIEESQDIGYVAFVVGDDNNIGAGTAEVIAAADLYVASVPEPSTAALAAIGLLFCLGRCRNRPRRRSLS